MADFLKRAAKEALLAAGAAAIIALFALSLFAVFVRAYAPADLTVALVDRVLKGVSCFLGSLIFVRRERALFKGAAAGVLALFLTTLIFGLIGGFHLTALFLADLLLTALTGGLGAVCGVKLRKE